MTEKNTKHETYKQACTRYQEAAGDLFKPPSKKHSTYEKNAWLLNDYSGELVAIVNPDVVVFGANLRGYMLQTAI